MGPDFEASVPRMEVSESIFCHQLQMEWQASGPLVQQDYSTKEVLEIATSVDVVFSSDRSRDRFTGKPVSQTTGLYYDYQRWYDPTTGRFISRDPLEGVLSDPQSLNGYVYVQNIPTVLTDPTGAAAQGPGCLEGLCEGPAPSVNLCASDPGWCNPEICAENAFICGGWDGSGEPGDGGSGFTICECPDRVGSGSGDVGGSGSLGTTDTVKVTVTDITTPTITDTTSPLTSDAVQTSSFFTQVESNVGASTGIDFSPEGATQALAHDLPSGVSTGQFLNAGRQAANERLSIRIPSTRGGPGYRAFGPMTTRYGVTVVIEDNTIINAWQIRLRHILRYLL